MQKQQGTLLRSIALLSSVLGIVACSQAVSTTQCASVSSVVTGGAPDSIVADFKAKTSVGGYLVGYHLPSPMAAYNESQMEKSYCAATVILDPDTQSQIGIWTAAHCIDFPRLAKLEFVHFMNGTTGYKLDLSLNAVVQSIASARNALSLLPSEVASKLMLSFSDPVGRSAQWCKEFTEANKVADSQQLCSSLDDLILVSFQIPPVAKQSADLKALLTELTSLPAIPAGAAKTQMVNWYNLYKVLADKKSAVAYARLHDKVRSCDSAAGAAADPGLCSNKMLLNLMLSAVFPTPPAPADATEATAMTGLETHIKTIRTAWKAFLPSSSSVGSELPRYSTYGNFTYGNGGVEQVVSGLSIPGKTAYLSLPASFGLTSSDYSQVTIRTGDRGVLVTRPSSLAKVDFAHGDSGTLFVFGISDLAFAPAGVFSTVNGEATSGGLAVHPAAEGSDGSDGSGGVNTTTTANPGKMISDENSTPAKAPPGGC